MKGEITLKILECIGDAAIDLTDLNAAILNSGYGASGKKITGEFHRRSDERIRENARRLERYRQKRRFNNIRVLARSRPCVLKRWPPARPM